MFQSSLHKIKCDPEMWYLKFKQIFIKITDFGDLIIFFSSNRATSCIGHLIVDVSRSHTIRHTHAHTHTHTHTTYRTALSK
jgi:hypothetical protein